MGLSPWGKAQGSGGEGGRRSSWDSTQTGLKRLYSLGIAWGHNGCVVIIIVITTTSVD